VQKRGMGYYYGIPTIIGVVVSGGVWCGTVQVKSTRGEATATGRGRGALRLRKTPARGWGRGWSADGIGTGVPWRPGLLLPCSLAPVPVRCPLCLSLSPKESRTRTTGHRLPFQRETRPFRGNGEGASFRTSWLGGRAQLALLLSADCGEKRLPAASSPSPVVNAPVPPPFGGTYHIIKALQPLISPFFLRF
jgi:hypothetical protein